MNELSLFTGAGGGLLGTMLLGFRPIGYVEWDDYCQRVIAARIKDGILPGAPIFSDIKTFIRDGYAASYQGLVDVITAGFPCQPFSVAGKQKGADDERNMWPATTECIGIVRPRYVLLENVPGIRRYLPVVVRDLRRLGYEVQRPLILGADDVGAPHRRKRVWIYAWDTNGRDESRNWKIRKIQKGESSDTFGICENVADTPERQDNGRNGRGVDGTTGGREGINTALNAGREDMADTDRNGAERDQSKYGRRSRVKQIGSWWASDPADLPDTEASDRGRSDGTENRGRGNQEIRGQSQSDNREKYGIVKPLLGRVAHGVAHRVDRLAAIGNGQVPLCVATAFRILSGGLER